MSFDKLTADLIKSVSDVMKNNTDLIGDNDRSKYIFPKEEEAPKPEDKEDK